MYGSKYEELWTLLRKLKIPVTEIQEVGNSGKYRIIADFGDDKVYPLIEEIASDDGIKEITLTGTLEELITKISENPIDDRREKK